MQYKIPVQIENEDPIFLGLSLRQLTIIMIGFGIAYVIFQNLSPQTGGEVALLPSGAIAAITVAIAIFKYNEMTFIPFILSLIRLHIFPSERSWDASVDSFHPFDVGFLTSEKEKNTENMNQEKNKDTFIELQEKLKNI